MGIRSTVEGLNQGPKVSLNLVVRLLSALHHESCDMCDMYCIVLRSSGCVAQNNLVPEQKPSIQACAVEPRDSKPKAEEPPPPPKKWTLHALTRLAHPLDVFASSQAP